mgnify:CR=1 FL=1
MVRKIKRGKIINRVRPKSDRAKLRESGDWPLLECLVSETWQEPVAITQMMIARRSPKGEIAIGVFLIDLGCLGMKDAFGRIVPSRRAYRQEVKRLSTHQEMVRIDLDLAAKIIQEAIAYARELGFEPHRDYHQAKHVIGDAHPENCATPIPLGKDGKPFYFAGPYDDVDRIMKTLTRKLGLDGFTYVVPLSEDVEFFQPNDG